MKTTDQFSKRFLSISMGVSFVLLSAAAFMFSIKPSYAANPATTATKTYQVGTAENYIPIGIHNGYAYWIIYNTSDGYKFRKANVTSAKWEEK